tara:strand:- start:5935 stop:6699 length:765 start_codon:yes stop_codon:yes gene_type:complete
MFAVKNISASIVVYNENINELQNTINSFIEYPQTKKLYIIDNSLTNILKEKIKGENIDYVFSGKNIGFGRGHNSILEKITNESDYHLILNPDVVFQPIILDKLIEELKNDNELSMIAPKVIYPNNQRQYTARKYPTFLELFFRFTGVFKKYTDKKEYRNKDLEKPFYPDFIHGNFMLFKTKDLISLHGFDKRYFLYMEDVDICKKIDQSGKKKMYFPKVAITHTFEKGSSKKIKLFFIHILSMIKYFMKWNFKI